MHALGEKLLTRNDWKIIPKNISNRIKLLVKTVSKTRCMIKDVVPISILDTQSNGQLNSLLWNKCHCLFVFYINTLPLSEQKLISICMSL